ncbi:hypothetical protein [Pseudomonas sp. PDM13]|uniref:hypothetical protein n=1 Tax=Pseudomonas sp. PDM13 TaxID=2769255 RepID=UPI0021DF9F37|nr:hypothetical protein [Pseudomonas sp. PDM13]MCU9947522.1 hypothetical protein [Pseudomonas sp. PDM13]
MTPAKCAARMQGLNGVAKKVYDCVPIVEAWTSFQVMGAMRSLTGSTPDTQIVSGCLTRLVDCGLVKRVSRDQYQRVPVQQKPKPEEPKMSQVRIGTPPTAVTPTIRHAEILDMTVRPTPMDLLATLARSASKMAEDLKQLSARIEEVALEVGEEREAAEKMRQLKDLLKDLKV